MTTPARRQSVRDYHARRTATGARKVTVWLSEGARAKLALLAKAAGSKDRAAEIAISAVTVETVRQYVMAPSVAQVEGAAFLEAEK